jgi:hypothetical protein
MIDMLANWYPLSNDGRKAAEKSRQKSRPYEHYAEGCRPTASSFSRLEVLEGGKDAGRTLLVLGGTFSVLFCVLKEEIYAQL